MTNYAANAFRAASANNCSAAGVNWEPAISPMRFRVRSATGSHSSAETPSINIAMGSLSATLALVLIGAAAALTAERRKLARVRADK